MAPPMPQSRECRTTLRHWRSQPHFSFPAPYDVFNELVRTLEADPACARLVDGIIVRIGRGDAPADISDWMRTFAARRGLRIQTALPYS